MTITTTASLTEEITSLVQQLSPAQQHALLVYLRVLVTNQQPRTTVERYEDTGETPIERFIRLGREVWPEGVSAADVLAEMRDP